MMGNENQRDTRKASIDLANWLAQEKIPPIHVMVRTFNLRYGFTIVKLRTLMDAYPEFKLNEETDTVERVE